jgi:DNA polymerase III subunit delta'
VSKPAPETPESDLFEGAPHPRFASHLVGHRAAEADMLGAYREGRLAHAWLIGGREGIGKATLAWRFARFVLANPDPNARAVRDAPDLSVPAAHPAARQLAAMAHPDFALLRREWNPKAKNFFTEIRVDDIRAGLDVFRLSSAFGGWRVAIVDAADDLNKESANALLKTIEEPPTRSLILIVAHRPGQLPPTIRSRCRRLLLEGLAPAEIGEVVRGLGAPWDAGGAEKIADAAARADGSVREALRRLDPEGQGVGALIDAAVAKLPRADPRAVHKLADAVNGRAAGDAFDRLTVALYDWLAARGREPSSPARLEAIAALWQRLRAATRETEAYNLDRKLHVLEIFEEISARSGSL